MISKRGEEEEEEDGSRNKNETEIVRWNEINVPDCVLNCLLILLVNSRIFLYGNVTSGWLAVGWFRLDDAGVARSFEGALSPCRTIKTRTNSDPGALDSISGSTVAVSRLSWQIHDWLIELISGSLDSSSTRLVSNPFSVPTGEIRDRIPGSVSEGNLLLLLLLLESKKCFHGVSDVSIDTQRTSTPQINECKMLLILVAPFLASAGNECATLRNWQAADLFYNSKIERVNWKLLNFFFRFGKSSRTLVGCIITIQHWNGGWTWVWATFPSFTCFYCTVFSRSWQKETKGGGRGGRGGGGGERGGKSGMIIFSLTFTTGCHWESYYGSLVAYFLP